MRQEISALSLLRSVGGDNILTSMTRKLTGRETNPGILRMRINPAAEVAFWRGFADWGGGSFLFPEFYNRIVGGCPYS